MSADNEGTPAPSLDNNDADELPLCGICEEPYDDDSHQAKFLTCHHTFCSHCLNLLATTQQNDNPGAIKCPNCRNNTQLPARGVAGLQRNFYIDDMQYIVIKTKQKIKNSCPHHSNQPMSFFCETCTKAICRDCLVLDHDKEAGHVITNVSDVEDSHRQAFLDQLNERRNMLSQIQGNMKQLEQEMALLDAAQESTKDEVEEMIQYAHRKLEERKRELIDRTARLHNAKQNILLEKQKHVQEAMDKLNDNLTGAEQMVGNGNLNEIINMTQNLMTSAVVTQSNFDELDLGRNYLSLDSDEGKVAFERCLEHLGDITIKGVLPTMIQIDAKEASVGQKAELNVALFSPHDETIPFTADHLTAEITDPEDSKVQIVANMTEQGYTVTFTPQMSGLHKVSGLFLGQQLTLEQTDISVSSINPVLTFGKRGKGNGCLLLPWDVVVDKDGCVYVCDTGNKLVQKFTADGEFLLQFSTAVNEEKSFTVDIEMDLKKEQLFCMELLKENVGNERHIQVFNLDGEHHQTYFLQNTVNASFLAITKNKRIVLHDKAKKCLTKVDTEGTILCHMGERLCSAYMCINAYDDNIIVVDRGTSCIQIFDDGGYFKHRFGTRGTGKGQLQGPWGVATDGEYILVSEAGNHRIQVFKMDGTFVSMIESHDDPIMEPRGLAVSNDGHVYMVEHDTHCIKKYKYRDMP